MPARHRALRDLHVNHAIQRACGRPAFVRGASEGCGRERERCGEPRVGGRHDGAARTGLPDGSDGHGELGGGDVHLLGQRGRCGVPMLARPRALRPLLVAGDRVESRARRAHVADPGVGHPRKHQFQRRLDMGCRHGRAADVDRHQAEVEDDRDDGQVHVQVRGGREVRVQARQGAVQGVQVPGDVQEAQAGQAHAAGAGRGRGGERRDAAKFSWTIKK